MYRLYRMKSLPHSSIGLVKECQAFSANERIFPPIIGLRNRIKLCEWFAVERFAGRLDEMADSHLDFIVWVLD